MTTEPKQLPRILDDDWEPPPREPSRFRLVAVCIGAALLVACVALAKISTRVSRPEDYRISGPIATPVDDRVLGGGMTRPPPPSPLPPRPPPAARRLPGYLSINSRPWAELSVDGQVVGNTPQVRVRVMPGRHHVLLARPGYQAHSAWVDVPAGGTVRLTNITLAEITP